MAVVTLFMSDRDTSKTFTSKKEADDYDKLLELAEAVTFFIEKNISDLDEQKSEELGHLIANNKELFSLAFKGKTEGMYNETQSEAVAK
jgi:dsDNA-binding SOS-regulon protein